jgi:DNA-binding MarR family transcriptional regulator
MTNTLGKLEISGYIHIRPDWDDARRKLVAISPAGVRARDDAIALVAPVISELVRDSGADEIKSVLPVLRNLRIHLE